MPMATTGGASSTLPDHVFRVEIRAPRERVWSELTKTGSVQLAMMNTVLAGELKPGSRLRYYSPDRKRVFVVGEVVEVDPPRRFSHTYMFTTRAEQPTLVTWELEETADGCRVTLTHGGFTTQKATHGSVAGGWREIIGLLKQVVETGTIPLRVRARYRFLNALLWTLPGSTRVSEVDRAGW
jgi:uncharacterized protein YndB with AHSA1/START domain